MIIEDYVSFEIAKLLKEKGFDCAGEVWYSEYTSQFGGGKYISIEFDDHNRFEENYKFICFAPTLQMARKWLREEHHLNIVVDCYTDHAEARIMTIEDLPACKCRGINGEKYEEACKAAIKYCLENLI